MFHEEEKLLKDAMKILISDDSLLLRKKLREELEKLGCEVHEAKDGDEAVEVFKNEKPDGIFGVSWLLLGFPVKVPSSKYICYYCGNEFKH